MDVTDIIPFSLELLSVICNLAFIVLLTKRKISAWVFGIVGSFSGAALFYMSQLYSETGLYLFYAVVGIYGWYTWSRPTTKLHIKRLTRVYHFPLVFLGAVFTYLLGSIMSTTDADKPYYDAFSSVFGVLATFLELYRYLSGWIYWIVLNLFSIVLYASKGIWIYAGLMVVYTVLSVNGYFAWRKLATND